MKSKPIATAFRLQLSGYYDKDPDIAFLCRQARRFGVLYIGLNDKSAKKILALGYRLPKKGEYYVLADH